MVLAFAAVAFLGWSFALKRLRVSARARHQLMITGFLTAAAVLVLVLLRLLPLAVLAILVGGLVSANQIMRDRREGDEAGFEDVADGARPQRRSVGMTREEALAVLGLEGSPSDEEIGAAHRRMIVRAHPDQGGSDYLAAKVNEARKVLLAD